MPAGKMHVDEVDTDLSMVGRLITTQFPQLAGLGIEVVDSAGTDNALYRLGDEMVVRLPRIPNATGQVDKEHELAAEACSVPATGHPCSAGKG